MGDSSGSVSIDVERIFFGGKVRARVPSASLGSSPRLGCAHSCGEGLIRCRGVCACSPSRLVALAGGLVGGCLLALRNLRSPFPPVLH